MGEYHSDAQKWQEYAQALARPFPIEILLRGDGGAGEADRQGDRLPVVCPIVERVRVTGVSLSVRDREAHAVCRTCASKTQCRVDAAVFSPIFVQANRGLVLVVLPRLPEDTEGFRRQLDAMAAYGYALGELLAGKMETMRVTRETHLLKKEISSMLSLSREPLLVLTAAGIIAELNQAMSLLFGQPRSQLIGADIRQFFPEKEWRRLRQAKDNEVVAVQREGDDRRGILWQVRTKSVFDAGKLSTLLLHVREEKVAHRKQPLQQRAMYTFDDIKGVGSAIRTVKETAKRIAAGDTTIMIRGESGTGKEVFAQAIHVISQRQEGPFIAINCAAIPESLLESELFGYEGGAFTGARGEGKAGRFEMANGGTLFLDEIGDMSLHLQAKLLRVVQERKVERIGGTQSQEVDVRIITATHRNLEKMVAEEKFREDLYYRLNVIPIHIPPLRERKEDIPLLIEYYMKKISRDLLRPPKRLSPQVMERLLHYHWPGNVRELENVVEHFVQLEIGDLITMHSLPVHIREQAVWEIPRRMAAKRSSMQAEKEEIMQLLERFGRDTEGKRRIAETLGISLPTLYRKMKRWRIR